MVVCRFWCVFGARSQDLELGPWRPWPSNHRDQFTLSVAVAIDVPLGGLDRPVTGQQLDVPQAAACLVHDPGGTGDEGPSAGMGRAAFQANVLERPVEPHDDAER